MASSPSWVVAVLELIGVALRVGVISESEDGHRCSRASNGALNHLRRVVVAVVVTKSYVLPPRPGLPPRPPFAPALAPDAPPAQVPPGGFWPRPPPLRMRT